MWDMLVLSLSSAVRAGVKVDDDALWVSPCSPCCPFPKPEENLLLWNHKHIPSLKMATPLNCSNEHGKPHCLLLAYLTHHQISTSVDFCGFILLVLNTTRQMFDQNIQNDPPACQTGISSQHTDLTIATPGHAWLWLLWILGELQRASCLSSIMKGQEEAGDYRSLISSYFCSRCSQVVAVSMWYHCSTQEVSWLFQAWDWSRPKPSYLSLY